MSTDGEKRRCFSRLTDPQGSCRLGPKYRLSKRVYSAHIGQPLTAAYLFAPNSYRIAKLVRNAGLVLLRDLTAMTGDAVADYPFIHCADRQFFLLAIYPEYHTDLFPVSILKNEDPDIVEDLSHTNTIHKVYIAKLALTRMKPGDVVVIYRTTDRAGQARYRSVVTSVCVVEEVRSRRDFSDVNAFLRFAKPHSVFTEAELREMYAGPD